jgi:hypothetical protein
VILQGFTGRSDDSELTGSTEWLRDVRRNHGSEVPAKRELERQVRARDPGPDSFARDDPIAEVVAGPSVDNPRNEANTAAVRARVAELAGAFPVYR